jgi:hypothetical protein
MGNPNPCNCFEPCYSDKKWTELIVHPDTQDRTSDAWLRLLELIDRAVEDQREEFAPKRELKPEDWYQITTLPAEIAKLKQVKHLLLYGSNLHRLPPEIGEMESLEEFTPYTSYNLHWFPYEITRCKKLRRSTVSTRALYGNYKFRTPFPQLRGNPVSFYGEPVICSVCGAEAQGHRLNQVWLSLRVATDVLPLLVNLCSKSCLESLPEAPEKYIERPHKGSLGLPQPKREWP